MTSVQCVCVCVCVCHGDAASRPRRTSHVKRHPANRLASAGTVDAVAAAAAAAAAAAP